MLIMNLDGDLETLMGAIGGIYHITRRLAPPYSLHTVLLKVESNNGVI
jgi:hypothetical protein